MVTFGCSVYPDLPSLLQLEDVPRDCANALYAFHMKLGYPFMYQNSKDKTIILKKKMKNSAYNTIYDTIMKQCEFKLKWTKEEAKTFLKEIQSEIKSHGDDYDGLIINWSSHGEDDNVLVFSDNQDIALGDISLMFNDKNCPLLKHKPRIFVVDACRGSMVGALTSNNDKNRYQTAESLKVSKNAMTEIAKQKIAIASNNAMINNDVSVSANKADKLATASEVKEEKDTETLILNQEEYLYNCKLEVPLRADPFFIAIFSTIDGFASQEIPHKGGILHRALRQGILYIFEKEEKSNEIESVKKELRELHVILEHCANYCVDGAQVRQALEYCFAQFKIYFMPGVLNNKKIKKQATKKALTGNDNESHVSMPEMKSSTSNISATSDASNASNQSQSLVSLSNFEYVLFMICTIHMLF